MPASEVVMKNDCVCVCFLFANMVRACVLQKYKHTHSPMQSYPLVYSLSGYSATYGMLFPTD